MIKNIIFDFDGVLVDGEILDRKAFSRYLKSKDIDFTEEEFSRSYSGNKLVEVIEKLSNKFYIKNKKKFFNEIINLSNVIYKNELKQVSGVKSFLE